MKSSPGRVSAELDVMRTSRDSNPEHTDFESDASTDWARGSWGKPGDEPETGGSLHPLIAPVPYPAAKLNPFTRR